MSAEVGRLGIEVAADGSGAGGILAVTAWRSGREDVMSFSEGGWRLAWRGFFSSRALPGMPRLRTVRATTSSRAEGSSVALKPLRISKEKHKRRLRARQRRVKSENFPRDALAVRDGDYKPNSVFESNYNAGNALKYRKRGEATTGRPNVTRSAARPWDRPAWRGARGCSWQSARRRSRQRSPRRRSTDRWA